MRFIFVPHALKRIKQRGVRVTDLKNVVKNDGKTKAGFSAKVRHVSQGPAKNGRTLEVVYDVPPNKSKSQVIIITSYYL